MSHTSTMDYPWLFPVFQLEKQAQDVLGGTPSHSLHPSSPSPAPLVLLVRARGHLSTKWCHCCPHRTLMTPQGGQSPFDFSQL